jgi:hypothetical protein
MARRGTHTIGSDPTLPVGIAPHAKLYKLHRGQSLDILLAPTDEDSFCKTAMSRREDIVSCIDLTIMDRAAHPVRRSRSLSMAGAGQDRLQIAVEALGLERRQSLITERGESGQSPIAARARDRTIENRSDGQLISLSPSLPNGGRLRAGHPYRTPKSIAARQTSRNVRHAMHAALRLSLPLAGRKASVSHGK